MFNRKAIVAVLVLGSVVFAVPAPASAGIFSQILTHAVKRVAVQIVKKAEHKVIRAIRRADRD